MPQQPQQPQQPPPDAMIRELPEADPKRVARLAAKARYRAANRAKLNAAQKQYYQDHRDQRLTYVRKWKKRNALAIKRYTQRYKDRQVEINRARRHADPARHNSKRRSVYASNPNMREKHRRYSREYKTKQPAKYKAVQRRYFKNNIGARLRQRLRWRVWSALRGRGIKKSIPFMELVGCDRTFLKGHIESQFEPWMTWGNYGPSTWHIDHKKPCAAFDLTIVSQQKECFHYSNLRPLSAAENIKKGASII